MLFRSAKLLKFKGEFAEHVTLGSYKIKEDGSTNFDVGKLNKAIAEYWEELGF